MVLKPDEVVYRLLQRLPTRVLSLRTIVIVAALSVVVLVLTLGTWVWGGVTHDQYSQLDRRLDSVSSLGDFSSLLSSTRPPAEGTPTPDGNLVRTVRIAGMAMSVPPDVVLPELGNGYANTTIDGVEYRVRTFAVAGATIALGAPLAETKHRIDELHLRVLLICAGVIIGTVVVGWLISLIMVNPFRLLAQQARAIVARILEDRTLTQAEAVAREAGLGLRSMQRLFQEYIGVSPKWGIQRYRLHDAMEHLEANRPVDLPALALSLGFFDQAHFNRAFRTFLGRTPTGYARPGKG